MERLSTGSGLDRISDFPSNVIDHILGFLPLKDAVRTSSSSKKWKEKWHTLPNVIVNEDLFHERSQRKIEGIISYVLTRHEGKIQKFSVSIEKVKDPYNMKLWIWRLSQKSVQELTLNIKSGRYHELPSVLFSCQQLRDLSLRHCEVKPSHSFRGFKSLVALQLNKIHIQTAAFEKLISSCPLLEQLTVRKISCIDHLHIDVPKLKYFFFDGEFKSMCFNSPLLEVLSVKLYRIDSENNQFDLRFKFRGLPSSIKELYVRCPFQKYMAACDSINEVSAYSQLRTLELSAFCFEKLDQVMCLLSIIGNSANLAILVVTACCCDSKVPSYPLTKFWEEQNNAPFSLKSLQKVRVQSFHGKNSEMMFIQFFMANSPVLEEVTVESVKNPEFDEDETKTVLQLSCTDSTKLKFIVENYESGSDDTSDSDDSSNDCSSDENRSPFFTVNILIVIYCSDWNLFFQ